MNIYRQRIVRNSKKGFSNFFSIVSAYGIMNFILILLTSIPSIASTTATSPKEKLL